MRILVVCYSRSGTTARLAREAAVCLRGAGHTVHEAAITPRRDLPYPLWLLLSFYPGARCPIGRGLPAPTAFDSCLLATPKWTLACPPVNQFLRDCGDDVPPTAVLLTCGGWDQDRYLRNLVERIGKGALGGLAVRRKEIEAGLSEQPLRDFLSRCFPAPPSTDD